MTHGEQIIEFSEREWTRKSQFNGIWSKELDEVFSDVAAYYDRANRFATLGLWDWLHNGFISTIELQGGQAMLDVCAGTNTIGISCMGRQPDLKVFAIDRSVAMQEMGRKSAAAQGFHVASTIGDVHHLPYPDNHFDLVTLRFASRHLKVVEVFREIKRVLKPGGTFYHCDMLRPANRIVENLYYAYLYFCLNTTALFFKSGSSALACRKYFVDAIQLFYSVDELSRLLQQLGFHNVEGKNILAGTVGYHKAVK